MRFCLTHGKIFLVLYVCLVSLDVDPGNGESEGRSGTPKNDLDCHEERRATRPQPDHTVVCIHV